MPLRNVPITYTLDQQRQEINALAVDVNNLTNTFSELVDDRVANLIIPGTGIASAYLDTPGTLTLSIDFTEFNTGSITEGTNLFYTDERVDDRVSNLLVGGTGISTSYNDNSNTLTFSLDYTEFSTSNIVEGTKLFFTDAKARSAITAQTVVGGDGTLSYDSGTGILTYTGVTASQIRGKFSASVASPGTTSIAYDSATGAFTYTPPSTTTWDTAYGWGNHANIGYLTGSNSINALSDVNTASPTPANGNALIWDSSTSNWKAGTVTLSGTTLQSRTTVSGTTAALSNGASGNLTITGFKNYALMKVLIDAPSWITIYTDTTSRTDDAARAEAAVPSYTAGVIAQATTTVAAQELVFGPGLFGFNNDATPSSNIYLKVVNKSGSTQAITVSLTILQLGV